jgi:hypothetical protein|nr:MAG TPA: hypothetical protein [Caudoviricetes sp.]
MANERLSLYFNTENETERLMWEYLNKDGKYGKSKNAKKAFEIMLEVEGVIPPTQLNRIFAESILTEKVNTLDGMLASTLTAQQAVQTVAPAASQSEDDDKSIIHTSEEDDDIDLDDDILN